MYEIQRVHIISLGRIVALIGVVVHIVIGLLATLVYSGARTLVLGGFFKNSVGAWSFFLFWVAGLVITVPLSFLFGMLAAGAYNLFSRWWGGLRVRLARIDLSRADEDVRPSKKLKKGADHA